MSAHTVENASFLEFSPAQNAAACLLLSMRFTGLLKRDKSSIISDVVDPSLTWDKNVEK